MNTITTDRYITDNDSPLRTFLSKLSIEYDRVLQDLETEEYNIKVEEEDEDFSGCGDEER